MRVFLLGHFLTLVVISSTHIVNAADQLTSESMRARWIQFTADGGREERSVYGPDTAKCPEGSRTLSPPTWASGNFNILACSRRMEQVMPKISKIVVLGDTGCRIKHQDVQACDEEHWPLRRIAELAAKNEPDLVVHVGDYLYRETCPNDDLSCPKFNVGNRWEAWEDDFFAPARSLLNRATWVFVRGNHEACGRAGAEGWMRLLSPTALRPSCPSHIPPYLLQFGDFNLLVADSSAPNKSPLSTQVAELSAIRDKARGAPTWLATHKPFSNIDALRTPFSDPDGISLVLSGHIHEFASYFLGPSSTSQIIVGTGGTALEPGSKFGYLLISREDNQWVADLHSLADKVLTTCTLRAAEFRCMSANN